MREVMATLGVDRPEDVPDAIAELHNALTDVKDERNAIRTERDEARAVADPASASGTTPQPDPLALFRERGT
jgi:hypothetical protein